MYINYEHPSILYLTNDLHNYYYKYYTCISTLYLIAVYNDNLHKSDRQV